MAKQSAEMEIAHVLFMDIVDYSRRTMAEQTQALAELQELVRATPEFKRTEASGELICLPMGDGMALVFFRDPVGPVQCAMQIARAFKTEGEGLQLRMGVHTGPVYRVEDINLNLNVSGGGINLAQRVMDCGDAGHILLSREAAGLLRQVGSWPLHDLGECEVKHGERLHLFNLFGDDFGNASVPSKLERATASVPTRRPNLLAAAAAIVFVVALVAIGLRPHGTKPNATLGSASTAKAKSPPEPGNSVAVLPFVNTDKQDEPFSDGMTEELINALAKVPGLRVPARTSAFQFKDKAGDISKIGAALNVKTVLEGRVQRSGNHLRITARLIRVADDTRLWSETYDKRGEMKDVFDVQDDITSQIVRELKVTLAGGPNTPLVKRGTKNREAYELYLKGRYHYYKRNADDVKKAVDYFTQATQKDPNYALAYAGLADSYVFSSLWDMAPFEAYPKAWKAVRKALQIDPTLAEAHTSLAIIQVYHDWDFARAEQEFKQAIQLDPNYALAHERYGAYLSAMGRSDEAIEQMNEALRIEPLFIRFYLSLGWSFLYARKYDQAIVQLRKTIDLDPNWAHGHSYLGWVYQLQKMYPQAVVEAEKARRLSSDDTVAWAACKAYALSGRKPEARKMLDDFLKLRKSKQRYVSPYYIAKAYWALGDKEQTFAWLEKAFEERSPWLVRLNVDPDWDDYRADPRFKALVKKVGLPEGRVSSKR